MNRLRPSKLALALTTLAVAAALAVAGLQDAKAEAAPQPGVWLVISHKVYDYDRWQRAHDRSADLKRAHYGWERSEQFAVEGDRNHVMVMERFRSREQAQAFANSRELTYEMAASGVSSEPVVQVVAAVNGISAR
jgi:hypothetical protein